jgi:hypothetical protein
MDENGETCSMQMDMRTGYTKLVYRNEDISIVMYQPTTR